MPLLITGLMFGDVNTISIPTDAIFIVSLLIIFVLIGYFFNNILSNQTNQVAHKIDVDSNLKLVKKRLEDQLPVDAKSLDQKNVEKLSIKKLYFLSSSKLLGLGGFACVAIGGASLLGLQHMQKSYQGVNTSRTNIKLENQFTKSPLSIVHLKLLNRTQKTIQKINYIDPFLKTMQNSNANHFHQVKGKEIENNFSF